MNEYSPYFHTCILSICTFTLSISIQNVSHLQKSQPAWDGCRDRVAII